MGESKPSRKMVKQLRKDLLEHCALLMMNWVVSLFIVVAFVLFATTGESPWFLLWMSSAFVVAFFIMTRVRRVLRKARRHDPQRYKEYLAKNKSSVILLDGPTGTLFREHVAHNDIVLEMLTTNERRLVDEFFAAINVVEIDRILSADSSHSSPECAQLREIVAKRTTALCNAIKAIREDVASLQHSKDKVLAEDAHDREIARQRRLADEAREMTVVLGDT